MFMAYPYKKNPKDKTYYVGFKDEHGRHVQRKTEARTSRQAQDLGDELEKRAERIRMGLEAPPPMPITFAQLVKNYLDVYVAMKDSPETYESRIRLHLLPTFGHLDAGSLAREGGG